MPDAGWIEFESPWLFCPYFDDEFIGVKAFEGLHPSGEIISFDEVFEVLTELALDTWRYPVMSP